MKQKTKEKEEKKGFFDKVFKKDKLKKDNKVAVVYLRDNGLVEFLEVEAKNGVFVVFGEEYHEERDCIYSTKKDRIPVAIIREWDLIPLGTKKWYDKEGKDEKMRERFSKLEDHVLRGIKNAELYKYGTRTPGSISTKQMILYIIIALVVGAVVVGYL